MKLCGHDYPEEMESDAPVFWPVARAWAASGGYSALSSGMPKHHGEIEAVVARVLREHAPDQQNSYIYRRNISRQRAYSALIGINKHPRKACRKELAAAFLNLFDLDAQFDLIRSDRPHGAGLLAIDRVHVGIVFAEFAYAKKGESS